MNYAIVLAGGTGKRLGAAVPKQFTEMAGRPVITYVLEILEKGGMDTWTVMTDRGECTFRIRSRVNDIKSSEDGRILFRDSSDNRYEVRDWTKLDKHSRHKLNAYV